MANRNNETVINAQLSIADTIVNSAVQADDTSFTVVNPTVQNYTVDIPAGTLLAGKYVVETPLSTNTGEANLYLCRYRNKTFVAKVYRRQSAIKDDIVLALEGVTSPHVAKLYETGTYNSAPFEILPYYKYGSLEGKTFSFERLRKEIIPALNDGLLALHKKNIIHKDLKPSNIMLCDDQKGVAIIDFGISSIREGGNTVVVTKTGMTPEYSAPETFRNLFLEESDVSIDMPYEEVSEKVKNAIADYFKLELGRPEILNRIGENIVVFDYIRPDTGKLILEAQIKKIIRTLKTEKKIDLTIETCAKDTISSAALSNLNNGGRGIGNIVESYLINPLSRFLFDQRAFSDAEVFIDSIDTSKQPVSLIGRVEKKEVVIAPAEEVSSNESVPAVAEGNQQGSE